MQLTRFTDYSLRVLLYLGAEAERLVTVDEIARGYGISRNHLVKVVNRLAGLGYVTTVRGKGGGVRLERSPAEINIGALVRQIEGDLVLLECFEPETNRCPIVPICGLKDVVGEARKAFLDVLDRHTLDEVLVNRAAMARLIRMPQQP